MVKGFKFLQCEVGRKYEPHFDYFMDDYNTENGGQRIATVLMYLTSCICSFCDFSCLLLYATQMLKRASLCFLLPRGIIVHYLGGTSYPDVERGGLSVKPKMGVMQCYSRVVVLRFKVISGHRPNGYM
ncbi:hypothetical protein SADUNF_Sadunf01G0130200 [Salix dunnii]|uniref:Prolyl 4-hydroxylase alpha subunit Fe(2+) 2OG dioxygenase domain-containing protein n=1 Tax=Salix dunnii TaxID=1413687 RepID=A0A835NBU7_9ROSI|nr:hypothetical protein SADUNF_Sadunf01G0130200 [Salix dunnii]